MLEIVNGYNNVSIRNLKLIGYYDYQIFRELYLNKMNQF